MLPLSRRLDWEARFAAWQADWRFARMDWRRADCLRLAAAACEALTGLDPRAELGLNWSTPIGARRVLARRGGDFRAAIARYLPDMEIGRARRGDWLLFDSGDPAFPGLAVHLGESALGFPHSEPGARAGLLPASAAIAAFAIG